MLMWVICSVSGKVVVWADSNTLDDTYIGTYDEITFLHNTINWAIGVAGAISALTEPVRPSVSEMGADEGL